MNEVHSYVFAIIPMIAWVASGCLKFAINSIKHGKGARSHIGNGGFPSTHTSVITSIAMLIGFTEGWDSPLFGLGVAVTMIVMIDATGVRRAVGENSRWINLLTRRNPGDGEAQLREKQGHTKAEIVGGLCVGTLTAWIASLLV
ncbi:divergent PAP2 family protein [Paenibacillus hemerocallicola]|uniref:Divergent PAP2 family protein n=1 Tax=Paenibacillus hemerocallicola TaxID=1172614 RepID=A0A5C4TAR1_9BACL|nr:divergent PAP2 family protein [Paenibacillus hemerocallicola]TNJ65690.1 divergent PAP2 family protein [Paenibacillus hemerocallicola]